MVISDAQIQVEIILLVKSTYNTSQWRGFFHLVWLINLNCFLILRLVNLGEFFHKLWLVDLGGLFHLLTIKYG
jgi:hypothetical protein